MLSVSGTADAAAALPRIRIAQRFPGTRFPHPSPKASQNDGRPALFRNVSAQPVKPQFRGATALLPSLLCA